MANIDPKSSLTRFKNEGVVNKPSCRTKRLHDLDDIKSSFEWLVFVVKKSKIDLNECNRSQQTCKKNIVLRHFEFMTLR